MSEETKQPTLNEELAAWLKEHNSVMVFVSKGPRSGTPVPVNDFLYETGIHIPAGWQLDVTVVEVKSK